MYFGVWRCVPLLACSDEGFPHKLHDYVFDTLRWHWCFYAAGIHNAWIQRLDLMEMCITVTSAFVANSLRNAVQ